MPIEKSREATFGHDSFVVAGGALAMGQSSSQAAYAVSALLEGSLTETWESL
jgi:hypothetical protein